MYIFTSILCDAVVNTKLNRKNSSISILCGLSVYFLYQFADVPLKHSLSITGTKNVLILLR